MAAKGLVKPGDARRGTRERVRESEVDVEWRGWRGEELVKHHAVLRVGADGREPDRNASKGVAFAIREEENLVLGLCTGKRSSSPD